MARKKKAEDGKENIAPKTLLDLGDALLDMSIDRENIFQPITNLQGLDGLTCKPLFCSFSNKPFNLNNIPLDRAGIDKEEEKQFHKFFENFPAVYFTYGFRSFIAGQVGPVMMGVYIFYKIKEGKFLPAIPYEKITDHEEEISYFIEQINDIVPNTCDKYLFIPDKKYRDENGLMNVTQYFDQMRLVGEAISRSW